MVEGARLERVYTGNRIEGSNPSLSANSLLPSLKPCCDVAGHTLSGNDRYRLIVKALLIFLRLLHAVRQRCWLS